MSDEEKKKLIIIRLIFSILKEKEGINDGKLNATETNWRRKHPLMRE